MSFDGDEIGVDRVGFVFTGTDVPHAYAEGDRAMDERRAIKALLQP